jgi:activating signal cointegrator complex subunit 3
MNLFTFWFLGNMIRNQKIAVLIKKCSDEFPALSFEAVLQPITRTILRIRLQIIPEFRWNDKIHGKNSEAFWLWIEDPENNYIYHYEYMLLTKKQVRFNLTLNSFKPYKYINIYIYIYMYMF